MRNQTINLNLIPGGVMPVVHLSQFDQDVDGSLIFNIYNGSVPYDLTDCVAHIQGHKPDGTAFDYQCTVHETYVTAATEYQMTVVAGQYQAEMRISKDGSAVGTVNLIFSVEPSTMTDVDLSHTDIPELMLEIEQAVVSSGASASASEESAEDSEAWAVGQRDGQDVPNTDPTYHNNAKYYAENSSQGVEDAEAWAIGERGGVPVTSGDPTYHNNSKYYSEESEGSAEDSEAWAVGERNGTPVTSGDPTYENNSEYWSGQSGTHSENSEAWAVGERGGVPVTSGDPTYENNAEYYAGEASSSATAAGTSETNAATSEGNAEAWATGQKNGSDVPATDPAYHNNSKYYSEQADDSAEDSEAWAVGERDGVPVDPSDPTYHNNAKYYSEHMGHPSLAGLTDVTLTSLTDDDILQYDSNSSTWVNVSGSGLQPGDMTGATAGAAGTHGLVPAPAAGDQNKVLNGDGTWKDLPAMTGATAGTAGTAGLVPAPSSGYQDKVLKGDGTWGDMEGGHTIINSSGTSMTQRAGLQFDGMYVTDDSTNDRTKVKLPIFNGTTAEWEALSSTEKAKYGVVNLTDDFGYDISTYATDEIKIGTFLGKDLYRKVYKVNLDIYNGSGDVPYSISPITGCLVDVYAIIYGGDKNSASFNTKDHGDAGCYYSETGNTVHIHEDIAGLSTVPLKVKAIVVEYTKEVWT